MAVGSGTQEAGARALAAWAVSLGAAVLLFTALGRGALSTPAVTDLGAWPGWLSRTDPATTAFAAVRLIALGAAWYLVGVTTIGGAARIARAARVVAVTDVLTVPVLRRALEAALGLGLATAAVTVATAAADVRQVPAAVAVEAPLTGADDPITRERALPPPIADRLGRRPARPAPAPPGAVAPATVDVSIAPAGPTPAADPPVGRPGPSPAEAAPIEAADPAAEVERDAGRDRVTEATTTADTADTGDAGEVGDRRGAGLRAATWTVRPGQHFWSIATAVVAADLGHDPTETQVAAYWSRLIDANRSRLAVADNPDLLFPDQVLALPS